jgi:TPR repeat protein
VGVVLADLGQFLFRRQAGAEDAADAASRRHRRCAHRLTPIVQAAASRRRTIRCATISSPIATGWRRCPTIPGMRQAWPGVEVDKINVTAADSRLQRRDARYPDVMRFVFEAGRVATARKDYAEARRLYEQAAAAGYAMAMNNIGVIYEGDEGFP